MQTSTHRKTGTDTRAHTHTSASSRLANRANPGNAPPRHPPSPPLRQIQAILGFAEAWRRAIPNIDPPKTPLSFMQPRPFPPSDIPSKLTLNIVLPYASQLCHREVDMVNIPATTGEMGILPGHVSTIAEMKPGVLSVHDGNGVKKYFVSGGFAYIHSNSYADIIAVEAVPVDQLDLASAQKGLAEFSQKLNSASTDLEKAEAQIGVDVYSAISAAISG